MKGTMKRYKTYKEHFEKWKKASDLVKKYNEALIEEWRSIPWWKFWVYKPSFEEQRSIIMENWTRFGNLPTPKLSDYFPINL